jgi:thiol-disulfide isomerase/thioredoxin
LGKVGKLLKSFKWSDWLVLVIVGYALVTHLPSWLEAWRLQGQSAEYGMLRGPHGDVIEFPPRQGNSIAVFWATWCGPCEIELGRLRDASRDHQIDPARIFAISFGEDPDLVRKTADERGYPFSFVFDDRGTFVKAFHVNATPTVVFLEDGNKVAWVTQGLSPTLVLRAQKHIPIH